MDTAALDHKMENPEDQNNFISNSFSIDDLKKTLNETNQIFFESLKNRFTQDLLASMVFFIFNEFCREKNDNFESSKRNEIAARFFSAWSLSTKKTVKKEILEINQRLKDDQKMNFLEAISDFSLPSTEDYQLIYDKAISEVQKIFEKNT